MWNKEVFSVPSLVVVHSLKFVCLAYFAVLSCISVFIATLLPDLNIFMNLQLYEFTIVYVCFMCLEHLRLCVQCVI